MRGLASVLVLAGWLAGNVIPASAQDVEIKICRPGYPAQAKVFFEKALGEFQKQHPGVRFKIIDADWETFQSRITVWVAGRQEPDIFIAPMQQYVDLLELGAFLPLDKYIDPALKSDIPESLWWDMSERSRGKGRYFSVAASAAPFTLWYNKEILAQAGLNRPPKTWDELAQLGKQIVDRTKLPAIGMNAARPFDTGQLLFGMLYYSATNQPLVDSRGRALFNSPDAVKAVQFWVDLYQKHKVTNPSPEQTSKGDLRLLFQQGKLAMHVDGPFIIPNLAKVTDMSTAQTSKFVIGSPFQSPIPGRQPKAATTVDQWVISPNAKHPDMAWKVIRHVIDTPWQYEHDRLVGQVPFRPSIARTIKIEREWIMSPMAEDTRNGILFSPFIPRSGQMWEVMNRHLVSALLGRVPVKEALDRAATEVNRLSGL